MPEKQPLFSLSIPFYNEEENAEKSIKDHVNALSKAGISFEILAVDNASADKTGEILDRFASGRVKVIHVKKNIGFGNGIMQGWAQAKGEYIGFTCGDNEVEAGSVVEILRKMQRENLDVGKGERTWRGYSWFRKFESYVYNKLFCRMLLGYRHGDTNGYPKIFKRSLYEKMHIRSLGAFFDTELMLAADDLGAKVGSVLVRYTKRTKGKSSVPFYIAAYFITGLAKYKLRRWFGKN